jgi:hypothetical protein
MAARRIGIVLYTTLACSAALAAQDARKSIEIVDGTVCTASVGSGFSNPLSGPLRDAANRKHDALTSSKRVVTLREFLGPVDYASVTCFGRSQRGRPVTDFASARTFLRKLLDRVIVSPARPDYVQLHPFWSEGGSPSIRDVVHFAGGTVGRIESDGIHTFVQDADGTYWWIL